MIFNMKKNVVVGISVNPDIGLEVVQVDYDTKKVLKYGSKPLVYNKMQNRIADLDLFKGVLEELLIELSIPKGSDIVLSLPTVSFKVSDYSGHLPDDQIYNAVLEEVQVQPFFANSNEDPIISVVKLPNSTIQFSKVASICSIKNVIFEIALIIKELGYQLKCIDTSVNSTLNALIYNERVSTAPDFSWVMLLIESDCCRVVSMQGRNYVDCFEERVDIGEILGPEENCAIISAAVNPILGKIPSQCLYVISKTSAVSAVDVANSIKYETQIIHQDSNVYSEEPYLEVDDSSIDSNTARLISMDVIGAAITRDFQECSTAHLNLFNESLGDIYTSQQPLTLNLGRVIELSVPNMIIASIVVFLISAVIILVSILSLAPITDKLKEDISRVEREIASIQQYIDKNSQVSTDKFNENDEVNKGLVFNKDIYKYYTIVGTEIPEKLWLTNLEFGEYITIEGSADNLESIYSFFRNIKDYNPESKLKLQKLEMASNLKFVTIPEEGEALDADSVLSSSDADFYDFKISNAPEVKKIKKNEQSKDLPLDLESIE